MHISEVAKIAYELKADHAWEEASEYNVFTIVSIAENEFAERGSGGDQVITTLMDNLRPLIDGNLIEE